MTDLFDEMENERRCMIVTLISGEKIMGHADITLYLEDDEGWDTIRAIWFKRSCDGEYIALRLEEVISYEVVDPAPGR